jgi:hypothetical protein
MNNTEIHNDLPEKDLRDFLTKSLADSYLKRMEIGNDVKYKYQYKNTSDPILGLDQVIANRERDLEKITIEIATHKAERAVHEIIKMKGWSEHDISDYVVKDYDDWYLSFIGTEEEYENLLLKLKE